VRRLLIFLREDEVSGAHVYVGDHVGMAVRKGRFDDSLADGRAEAGARDLVFVGWRYRRTQVGLHARHDVVGVRDADRNSAGRRINRDASDHLASLGLRVALGSSDPKFTVRSSAVSEKRARPPPGILGVGQANLSVDLAASKGALASQRTFIGCGGSGGEVHESEEGCDAGRKLHLVDVANVLCRDRSTKIETARGEIMRIEDCKRSKEIIAFFDGLNVQEGKTISFQSLFRSKVVRDDISVGRLIHGNGRNDLLLETIVTAFRYVIHVCRLHVKQVCQF
jgi:hypothetical protein